MDKTYSLDADGEWFLIEDEVDMDAVDDLVEKLGYCKEGWNYCASEVLKYKTALIKGGCPT